MAWVPAAHAVQIVSYGPCKPYRIEIAAPAALGIIIGTRNGETRRSPFSTQTRICSSSVCRPPTPVAKIVPKRAGSTRSRRGHRRGERLGGGGEGELREAVGAPGLLRAVEPRLGSQS